jgi:hypothetical protein
MQTRFISYLDLMCCGFGGALLMFLIVASARERIDASESMLVVRCWADGSEESSGPISGAEVGIEYRRAGTKDWIRANGLSSEDDLTGVSSDGRRGEKWVFFPTSASGQPVEAVLICQFPRPGRWEFRAYMADFSAVEGPSDGSISVTMEFLGAAQNSSPSHLLLTPGMSTGIVSIDIQPSIQ